MRLRGGTDAYDPFARFLIMLTNPLGKDPLPQRPPFSMANALVAFPRRPDP